MDGLSTAGGVVSLVTIIGQLIQSTRTLYDFWSSVKDVPTRLQWLSEDLKLIQEILENIEQQSTRNPTTSLCEALQRCAFYLGNLDVLVAPLRSRPRGGRKEKIWRSIKAVFSEDKIELYRENLESAKTTLLLTQSTLVLTQNSLYQSVVKPHIEVVHS